MSFRIVIFILYHSLHSCHVPAPTADGCFDTQELLQSFLEPRCGLEMYGWVRYHNNETPWEILLLKYVVVA